MFSLRPICLLSSDSSCIICCSYCGVSLQRTWLSSALSNATNQCYQCIGVNMDWYNWGKVRETRFRELTPTSRACTNASKMPLPHIHILALTLYKNVDISWITHLIVNGVIMGYNHNYKIMNMKNRTFWHLIRKHYINDWFLCDAKPVWLCMIVNGLGLAAQKSWGAAPMSS